MGRQYCLASCCCSSAVQNSMHTSPILCTGLTIKGQYPYTSQLKDLASWDNSTSGHPKIPSEHSQIVSPVDPQFWKQGLADHPDREFASLIVHGLTKGFRIGFNPTLTHLQSAGSNLQLAALHPEVISQYLERELRLGRVAELSDQRPSGLQVSPLGVVPKKGRPNKWRMIMDLSSPEDHSVNDGIIKESCSFHYTSINEAAVQVLACGPGTLMAKMDVQQAYCNIPVAPKARHLLGLHGRAVCL